MAGPLQGLKVLEMAGIGPAPFCAMLLADMGAEVIRVDRLIPGVLGPGGSMVDRGRKSIAIDPKKPGARNVLLKLVEDVDILIEGFRPGVMERLGLGPEQCLASNPRLIYGRMTGWGQDGPLALAAGHDINYIALTGALHSMGHADRAPTPPLHLVGDMGGGAMMLALGIVSALHETRQSGKGQVIDAAICDGTSLLTTMYHSFLASGKWQHEREANLLDGGAHFYGCYTCADGKFVSVGPVEPQFYHLMLELCGITDADFAEQWNRQQWPALRSKLEALFLTRSRDEWAQLLEGSDACVAPVLDFAEASRHRHHVARNNFIEVNGAPCPAPAPRFSRTPSQAGAVPRTGEHTISVLQGLGLGQGDIARLRAGGAIA
ncbi:CaiB/BaiF CoA-transferase family protein [Pseudomonas sp. R37(2017)]|uniref:CaiB/BaiF CoA transferase family protein n=1 Tax=Pseudomonas sp. R37(2017) TaxID=1981685 RepID=UPI000A1EA2A8|nr:CaiB/BaiF CoA-transferase family protein [Pseudomonas sp. R37(2017)]